MPKVSDAFELRYAMHSGFFTDKAEVKRILGGKDGEGMTTEQLAKLRTDYVADQQKGLKPGEKAKDLDTDVRASTGSLKDRWGTQSTNDSAHSSEALLGRDGLEIRQLLRGQPTTATDKMDRANETYKFEREGGGVSNFVMDHVNGRGATLDRQNQLLNEQYKKANAPGATDDDKKKFDAILGRQSMDVKGYQETKDSASNAAAATAAIAASAALTVATGGGGSPLLAAAIAGAGGLAGMGTKMALQGNDYGYDDARSDLANTAVQAGTAGLMKVPGIDKALNGLAGVGANPTIRQLVTKEVISNFASSSINSLGQSAVNPASYQGDPNQAFWGAMRSAGASGVGGALTAGLNKYGGSKVASSYLNTALVGATSSAAGTAVTNTLNPAAVTGGTGDQAASWLNSIVGGGVGNMAGMKAEHVQKARDAAANSSNPAAATKPVADPAAATTPVVEPEGQTKPVVEPAAPTKTVVEPEGQTKPVVEPEGQTKPVVEPEGQTKPVVEPEGQTKVVAPKVKPPLNPQEQALADLRKDAKTPEDHAYLAEVEAELAARRQSDTTTLEQMIEDTKDRKTTGEGKKGIVSVDDTRGLRDLAGELGVSPSKIPKPSSVEETLRAKGMTDEEMKLLGSTLNKDQQSRMPAAERERINKESIESARAKAIQEGKDPDVEAQKARVIHDDANQDVRGEKRGQASQEELQAALKANILLFEDVQVGSLITKVVPEKDIASRLVNGKAGASIGGDVGLNRNGDGMSAEQKIKFLGLDYRKSDYTKVSETDDHGNAVKTHVEPKAAEKLYQVETQLTKDMVANAKVPMGFDMVETAKAERNRLVTEMRTKQPGITEEQIQAGLPTLLQTDEHGDFKHIKERPRYEKDDPSAGFGYTASQGLRGEDGKQFFQLNQELTFDKRHQMGANTNVNTVDKDGNVDIVARMDDKGVLQNQSAP